MSFPQSFNSARLPILKIAGLFLLLSLSLGLRIHNLDYESLYMDELRQVSYYPLSPVQIIFGAASQQQPPLDYWIGHIVCSFSYSDFAVRLPAALFGVGAVLLFTLLTAKLCSWPVALVSGTIYSLLSFNLYFSQECRPYSIAIFFLLGVVWSLDRLLDMGERRWSRAIVFFLFAIGFLFSRTLSPLVVTFVLLIILASYSVFSFIKGGFSFSESCNRAILAALLVVLALLFYYPIFVNILGQGPLMGVKPGRFLNTILKIDLLPLWKAYVVQTEPLSRPVLVLLLVCPWLAWRKGEFHGKRLWTMTAILLPAAALLNVIVFQAETNGVFRPPYAIYLLPLSLFLAAVAVQHFLDMIEKLWSPRFCRFLSLFLAIFFISVSIGSAVDFKSVKKKTDWRNLCSYLVSTAGDRQLLLFDSLAPYGNWEPTLYGFPRYYSGKSQTLGMAQIPFVSAKFPGSSYEPVLILFKWREYSLTPDSRYPFIPISDELKSINYEVLTQDSNLAVTEFVGFSVIRLEESSGSLAKDTYVLVERLLAHMPENSSLIELYLAGSALAKVLDMPVWEDYLMRAEELATGKWMEQVKIISEYIRSKVNISDTSTAKQS